MSGLATSLLPLVLSIVKFFIDKSALKAEMKKSFMEMINKMELDVKDHYKTKLEIKENRKKLKEKLKNRRNENV